MIKKSTFFLPLLLIFFIFSILISCSSDDFINNDQNKIAEFKETETSSKTSNDSNIKNEIILLYNTAKPKSLTIKVGETVTWRNMDRFEHTVVSGTSDTPLDLFYSGSIRNGGTFNFSFNNKGTFPFYCQDNPDMVGEIIVE